MRGMIDGDLDIKLIEESQHFIYIGMSAGLRMVGE
jgi:hypothetical protein